MKTSDITTTRWFCCFLLLFAVDGDVYLSLDLPKLRFFSTVHLTVDDQDVGEASDVASLHLQRSRMRGFKAAGQMHDPVAACEPGGVGLTVGWYFSQFSHHAWVLCSRQMLFFKISAKSYSFTLSEESNKGTHIKRIKVEFMLETRDGGRWNPTVRVVFRVMHGEQQC